MELSDREKAMKQLSAAALAAHDAQLFLNTHPDNLDAIDYFNKQKSNNDRLMQEYAATYGPITSHQTDSTTEWTWIDSPWPWEMEN